MAIRKFTIRIVVTDGGGGGGVLDGRDGLGSDTDTSHIIIMYYMQCREEGAVHFGM